MKTAEQITKIFSRGNHMHVPIVRKVPDATPDPRGAHPRPSNIKKRREGHLVLKAKLKWVTPVGKKWNYPSRDEPFPRDRPLMTCVEHGCWASKYKIEAKKVQTFQTPATVLVLGG